VTRFDLDRLAAAAAGSEPVQLAQGARLELPSLPQPFIPPKLVSLYADSESEALAAEVVIVSSPAAVGKSTAASYLAATCNVPLLNLAKVYVSTNALVGLLTTDIVNPTHPVNALHAGELSIIVDALDEGRLLSGDANFEKFLETTWELLLKDRSVRSKPKLIFFGRDGAAELLHLSIQLYAEDLTVSSLNLDFFDRDDAVEVVEAHARATAEADGRTWIASGPSRDVIDAFFSAIESALKLDPGTLWSDSQGRAFGGYAPVLAAIGSLLSREQNPIQLLNALEQSGAERAWQVIERVSDTILKREQEEKVRPQLARELSREPPPESYDPYEQLTYLMQIAQGKSVRLTTRVDLAGKDRETYRRMIGQHLAEHPFLQQGHLANDVLASIVLAHAIGNDLLRESDPGVLRQASRQPFLWRSVQRFLDRSPGRWLAGNYMGCVLNSLWNDSVAQAFRVKARPSSSDRDMAEFTVEQTDETWTVEVRHPIEFYEQLRDSDCHFTSGVVWQGHYGNQESEVFDVGRDVTFMAAGSLDVRATTVRIEGDVRLLADQLSQSPNLRLFSSPGTRVWWGGAFAKMHPWNEFETSLESPEERLPTSQLEVLLQKLAAAFPPGAPITLFKFKLRLTDDRRTAWIGREFSTEKFSSLIDLLLSEGLARTEIAQASGHRPMVRVHFNMTWEELLRSLRHPDQAHERMTKLLAKARELFA
jgi:hypothetical protein